MSKSLKIISPISIDLGAKNTGVYFAHYQAGSSLSKIKKSGKVYQFDNNSYTFLMANRTANRHQRRGYDRRQMVKRLFKLIWEKHFKLSWDKDVQQIISFLLNRRGFTFLTEEYNCEILSQFPKKAYDLLPEKLQKEVEYNGDGYDFDSALTEWSHNQALLKEKFQVIESKYKNIKKQLFAIIRIKTLKDYCNKKIQGKEIIEDKKSKIKLSELPKWVFEKWIENKKIKVFLPKEGSIYFKNSTINIVKYLNEQDKNIVTNILENLPDVGIEETRLKNSIWNFNLEKFDLEKAEEKFNLFNDTAQEVEITQNNKLHIEYLKTHIHHLAFALYKTHNEIQSGSRHRSRYFEEVKNVLKFDNHTHGYLEKFCKKLHSGNFKFKNFIDEEILNKWNKSNTDIEVQALSWLIGHLSNFELKPLRKYFNDKKHKKDDYWDESRLAEKFENWILREWRVNPTKDKKKVENEKGDYKQLKCEWEKLNLVKNNSSEKSKEKWRKLKEKWEINHKGKLINFWLSTDPFLTIPPYQGSNNRRPPKCQSLIFNPKYLDRFYSKWTDWLENLKEMESVQDYLNDYENQLKNLKSSGSTKRLCTSNSSENKFSYFREDNKENWNTEYQCSLKHLKARILQFIFDRVKGSDVLKLNDIYSYTKKYRQYQSTEQEKEKAKDHLESVIKESKLPKNLKPAIDYKNEAVFAEGSFLHLICKYYKWRQRAKAGRIFIHPKYRYINGRGYENTGRFDDRNCLLTYCNCQPRQKRYQMLGDLAGLLQISPPKLKKFIEQNSSFSSGKKNEQQGTDEKIFHWLNSIKSLKANCNKAAKEQKHRRGELKSDIQVIYNKTKSQQLSATEIRNILNDVDKYQLYQLCQKAVKLYLQIVSDLCSESVKKRLKQDLHRSPATAVFFLAQINNIVFKERTGNAKTCAVCSMDNAQRMQTGKGNIRAKAQRLPAIPTRIIDGAVMKMARIVGNAIADDKWKIIKSELEKGNKVCIPIIMESNHFEFEPNLKFLKGQSLNNKDKQYQQSNPLIDKEERIKKESSQNMCPYTGEIIGESGEIDHIIPRSSRWGTLNDETNLIWSSQEGNKNVKGKNIFSLKSLNSKYKQKQFDTTDDKKITNYIIKQIGDGSGEDFKFGKYRNFIDLNLEQQKAFRHALFLVGHPIRDKVIRAIDNRTRTLVNGTQRYFAEVLANNLYKKALSWKIKNKDQYSSSFSPLKFDYFSVQAWDNTRGNGVKDLRKELVEHYRRDLRKFDKQGKGQFQTPYSHLLDAQVAFCMTLYEHQKEGSFRLNLKEEGLGLWSRVDRETGEIKEDKDSKIYDASLFDAIQVSENQFKEQPLKRRKVYKVETHYRESIERGGKSNNSISYQIHRDGMIAERFFSLLEYSNGEIKKGFTHKNSVPFLSKENFSQLKPFIKKVSKKSSYCSIWVVDRKKVQHFLMDVGYKGANLEEKKIAKMLDQLSYQIVKKEISLALKTGNSKAETVKEANERWKGCIRENNFIKDGIVLPIYKEWKRLRKELEVADPAKSLQNFLLESDVFNDTHKNQVRSKRRKVFSLPVRTNIGNIRVRRQSWNGDNIIQTTSEKSLARYGYNSNERPHTILSKNSIPKKHYSGIPENLSPQPLKWVDIPINSDIADDDILSVKVKIKDANRCIVKLTVQAIKNRSLPQDKPSWEGKVIQHNDEASLKKAQEKSNGVDYHCLKPEYYWFKQPFNMPRDRNNVKLRKCPSGYDIEFTIQKTQQIQKWLLNK